MRLEGYCYPSFFYSLRVHDWLPESFRYRRHASNWRGHADDTKLSDSLFFEIQLVQIWIGSSSCRTELQRQHTLNVSTGKQEMGRGTETSLDVECDASRSIVELLGWNDKIGDNVITYWGVSQARRVFSKRKVPLQVRGKVTRTAFYAKNQPRMFLDDAT